MRKMKEYFRPGAIFFLRAGVEGFNSANSRMRYRLKINRVKTHSLTHTLYG